MSGLKSKEDRLGEGLTDLYMEHETDKLIRKAIDEATKDQAFSVLNNEQAERFMAYTVCNQHLLQDIKVIRLYPWYQLPVRKTLGSLASRLRLWQKRWEGVDYDDGEEPRWHSWVDWWADATSRLEGWILRNVFRDPWLNLPLVMEGTIQTNDPETIQRLKDGKIGFSFGIKAPRDKEKS